MFLTEVLSLSLSLSLLTYLPLYNLYLLLLQKP